MFFLLWCYWEIVTLNIAFFFWRIQNLLRHLNFTYGLEKANDIQDTSLIRPSPLNIFNIKRHHILFINYWQQCLFITRYFSSRQFVLNESWILHLFSVIQFWRCGFFSRLVLKAEWPILPGASRQMKSINM